MEPKRDTKAKLDFIALIIILSAAAVVAHGYFKLVAEPSYDARFALHQAIIEGTAPSPYRYRILVPFIAEPFIRYSPTSNYKEAFVLTYEIYDLLAIFFLLAALFIWLKNWFTREQALTGVLFVAATMPIALKNHYFQPWSLLEAALLTTALLAIYRKRHWLLAFIVLLASLNRETGVFIPLAFLLASVDLGRLLRLKNKIDWKPIMLFAGYLLLWAAVFFGNRYFRGTAPPIETVEGLWARNTTRDWLYLTFVNGSLFLGGFWVFAVFGFRYAPAFIRRVALIIPAYLVTVMLWGVWYEVRLLMPLYPVLLPLGLSFVFRQGMTTMSPAIKSGDNPPIPSTKSRKKKHTR